MEIQKPFAAAVLSSFQECFSKPVFEQFGGGLLWLRKVNHRCQIGMYMNLSLWYNNGDSAIKKLECGFCCIFMRSTEACCMDKGSSGFFLVKEDILPEAIKKTIRVKEMLKRGEARTINEAVASMDLSRSAYYKYKDYVFPFYEASQNKTITLALMLEHKKGVLSSVLGTIAAESGNVLTINQGLPLQGVANMTVAIETMNMTIDLEALMDKLRMVEGVKRLEVVGQA